LNASGSALAYSTFLGGGGSDEGRGIAVDGAGNAHVTGLTASTNFPTASAAQTSLGGGAGTDAFLTKLNSAGTALSYSTYLGGAGTDEGHALAVDGAGNAYVTGATASSAATFPETAGAYQTALAGGRDAFAARYSAAGALAWASYLGGSGN